MWDVCPASRDIGGRGINSVSAGLHLANIPRLADSTTVMGDLRKLRGAVVKDLVHRARTGPASSFELATGVLFNHCLISNMIGVVSAGLALRFVILDDSMLLSCFDALPISFKGDVKWSISAKH